MYLQTEPVTPLLEVINHSLEQLIAERVPYSVLVDALSKNIVKTALKLEKGNHCAAARRLQIHRNSVNRILRSKLK